MKEDNVVNVTLPRRPVLNITKQDENEAYGQRPKLFQNQSADDDDVLHLKQKKTAQMDDLFSKTRKLIEIGATFKFCSKLYSERKLFVLVSYHIVITIVIWIHFSTIKLNKQNSSVLNSENRYLWKLYAPTIVYGLKHAILFQMTLLPLTMARHNIASFSTHRTLATFIPFNRMMN